MCNSYINRSCALNLIFKKKKRITRCIWSPFKNISHNHYDPFLIQHPRTPMTPFSFQHPRTPMTPFSFNTPEPLWPLSHSNAHGLTYTCTLYICQEYMYQYISINDNDLCTLSWRWLRFFIKQVIEHKIITNLSVTFVILPIL